ncbi:hypothetical protein M2650_08485 [Luteimonas sp. SX5]|uniref:Lipoprotein n=1 Tax=Luteimonas galliterrae TaxID=2940486 RepID=A0ABT0MIF8_9GAMM|nr:hypothetical protein [Luteimonas galliterrae]MCL1634664.1 hypothetical protein [Luteimonas galliterrae]
MGRIPLLVCAILTIAYAAPSMAETVPSSAACSADAIKQAKKLLVFHLDGEDKDVYVGDEAKPLPSIVNPASSKQRFDVLEVRGSFYKGEYRMRFEYFRMKDGECVLMGQEILEIARL